MLLLMDIKYLCLLSFLGFDYGLFKHTTTQKDFDHVNSGWCVNSNARFSGWQKGQINVHIEKR